MAQYMDRGLRREATTTELSSQPETASTSSHGSDSVIDGHGEDRYWHDNYRSRPYADDTLSYDHYRPAYRYGWESRHAFAGQRWDQVERDLQRGWRQHRGASRLGWGDAKLAARDAWQRASNMIADQAQDAAS